MNVKKLLVLILILLAGNMSHAQPTQAEIDKMMKQAQELMKKYGGDSTVKNAMKNQQSNNANVDNWKFPVKNVALLSSLPKKVFTKAELVSFLNDLYAQLSKKL